MTLLALHLVVNWPVFTIFYIAPLGRNFRGATVVENIPTNMNILYDFVFPRLT